MAEAVQVHRAAELEGIPHGFLGRVGGVSTGLVAGLNLGLGTGDDAAAVAENRARAVAAVLPGARLVTVYQVHSADCVVAGEWSDDARPHADALATDQPGLLLGVVTADNSSFELEARADVPVGHKVALRALASGDPWHWRWVFRPKSSTPPHPGLDARPAVGTGLDVRPGKAALDTLDRGNGLDPDRPAVGARLDVRPGKAALDTLDRGNGLDPDRPAVEKGLDVRPAKGALDRMAWRNGLDPLDQR